MKLTWKGRWIGIRESNQGKWRPQDQAVGERKREVILQQDTREWSYSTDFLVSDVAVLKLPE